MRSSLFKHIWLIQPPDPIPPVHLVDAAGGATVRFAPSWELMCLQAFLLERTGHTCSIIDTRIHESLGKALDLLGKLPDGKSEADVVAVIHADVLNLGPVGLIASHIHQHHPEMTTVLSGPMVDSFPDLVPKIPHVHFGLCGDPEVILRNLLDFIEIRHRLKLVPGLIIPDEPTKPPHWMQRLQGLSLPEWYRVHWSLYQNSSPNQGIRVEARLSRGSPGKRTSIALAKPDEPVRLWSLPAMAQSFQKSAGQGISEIFLADPPDFWTDEQMMEWCRLLNALRNTQPWAIQLVPRMLSNEVLDALAGNACHRVEFIVPSASANLQSKYGMHIDPQEFRHLIERMTERKILVNVIYWIHGPDAGPDEADLVYRHLMVLGFPKFALHPFPFHHDSRLYAEVVSAGGKPPPVTDWLAWAKNPTAAVTPVALWNGSAGLTQCRSTILSIQRKVMRNPRRHLLRVFRRMHHFSRIATIEQRIADWFNRRVKPQE